MFDIRHPLSEFHISLISRFSRFQVLPGNERSGGSAAWEALPPGEHSQVEPGNEEWGNYRSRAMLTVRMGA